MTTAEDELTAPAKDYQSSQIEIGTVGWEGQDEHVEFGTDDNDGHTLICVTVFRGRSPGEPVKKGVAQGHKIRCHISSLSGARIPPRGTRVLVAIPFGMEQLVGAGVIIATIEKTATKDQLQKNRVVIDYGPDTHVVIKGKSVSLSDHDDRFLTVGTPRVGGDAGLIFQAADGSGGLIKEGIVSWFVAESGDAKSVIKLSTSGVELVQKSTGFVRLKNGEVCVTSSGKANYIASSTFIGVSPLLAGKAVTLVAGLPVPSGSVNIGLPFP